ncbi:MAG: anthranilate phosphoribosyltransferase [bacterium]|nr:anthranilate phosphoribosyltransferase [bacterium]
MIQEAIKKVVEKNNLSEQEIINVMREIMTGSATPAQIACFITVLRLKGETVEEITGCAKVMREVAKKINVRSKAIVDTCGTGGDGMHTFNISTTAAFVVAGAGLAVAKHGNRSVSSKSGSADVLQELGINIEADSLCVEDCVNSVGIGFLFAPLFHPAMKFAIGPRREIGIRTVFNILGPLTNPADAGFQVLGVYDDKLTEVLANVLQKLGSKRAFVVHGEDGLDEITTTGKTKVSELKDGKVTTYFVTPEDFGFKRAVLSDLLGGSAKENAEILLSILKGEKGPRRDIVLLNAAFAINACGKVDSIKDGIKIAAESIDSGKALGKLESLKEKSRRRVCP